MDLRYNAVFISGGNSGIGRGLAVAFHRLGNKVIIRGRREEGLMYVAAQNPGIGYVVMDVTDPVNIRAASAEVTGRFSGELFTHNQLAGRVEYVCSVNPHRRKALRQQFAAIDWDGVWKHATARGLLVCRKTLLPVRLPASRSALAAAPDRDDDSRQQRPAPTGWPI